jgi:uncharacterized protein (TIGR02246 family)
VLLVAIAELQGQARPATGDERDVREVVRRYTDARQLQDPGAIEALFTEDADQFTTSGEWRRGRAAIVAGTQESSRRNPGTRTITIDTVRFVGEAVAIADGPYEIREPGVASARRMWTTIVLRRTGNQWRIAAIRNMVPSGSGAPAR